MTFYLKYLCIVIPHRINFKQVSRYSKHCKQRFRNQFKEKFNFMSFISSLINYHIVKRIAISFDPGYIEKSGNKIPSLGSFWSRSDQRSKKGLEISQIALIDIDLNQSFHLEAVQSVPSNKIKNSLQVFSRLVCSFYC